MVVFRKSLAVVAVVCGACATCNSFARFTDITSETGISHVHSQREDPANNHAGVSAFDVNDDGLTDLIFARFDAAPLLYVNQGDGSFVDETVARGLSGAHDTAAVAAGDLDNDGDLDLFMAPHQGNRFFLFINDGSGQFTEEAIDRGADVTVELQPHKGYSVGLVDYNLDGYLDISVSEWGVNVDSESDKHSPLLKNRGEAAPGSFTLATTEAGVEQPMPQSNQHTGYSNAWADFDGDGWQDLALVADFSSSQMYWNNGNGTFTQTTKESGVGIDEFGMGVAVADYNADGLLDFFVTSIFDQFSLDRSGTHTGNKLYRNLGNRIFQESAEQAGVSRSGWGWGTAFVDYDNDSDFDLLATNGHNLSEGGNSETTPLVAAASDPTTLFLNDGSGSFSKGTSADTGIVDKRYGKGLVVLDYDNDGDQDFVIANTFSDPIIYENDASANGNDWIRFTFEGTISNRDGIGTQMRVTENGVTQTLLFNPTNAYLGQHEAALHFGLGDSDGTVDSIEITWPTGLKQTLLGLAANVEHHLLEPEDEPTPPLYTMQPEAQAVYGFGDSLELHVAAVGSPAPVFTWEKDGEAIEGQTGSRLFIKRLAPGDSGVYRALASSSGGNTYSVEVTIEVDIDTNEHSIARWWNEFLMEAVRKDFPDPTVHSRNLYHTSAAMWDAFWAYEVQGWAQATEVFHRETVAAENWGGDRLAAQREAISHAAFTILTKRYENSPGSERSLFGFRWLMEKYGFDPDFVDTTGDSPAAVGNRIGNAALSINYADGSNELNNYEDTSGYAAANDPLLVEGVGTVMSNVNRWQPLQFDNAVSQNGIPIGTLVQTFLGVNWREVDTFAMKKTSSNTIAFDPGPPPLFGTETHEEFVDAVVEVIRFSSYLDPSDGVMVDISPGALLNNRLGTNDGTGRPVNPHTGQPYEPNVVKHADYGRILAEFWADGPASETPPGHWNSLHNEITDHPLFERRYMGLGEELPELEWDIRAYLALNGGMHDAAIAAWTLKRQYDYSRPVSMIRELCGQGQSSDPGLPSYSENGIPLVPGLIELITAESSAAGERHEHLASAIGEIAIFAWAGEPSDPHTEFGGVDWILGEAWLPYQRSTFVSPAFAAYVSGHSTFSRSGAEVMTLLTGSPYFPGGMGEFLFPQSEYLEFEDGPSEDVTLQWATYYDAADQAGLSRLYGGIHVRADDFIGRTLGARIGVEAFLRAHTRGHIGSDVGELAEIYVKQGLAAIGHTALASVRRELMHALPVRLVANYDEAASGEAEAVYFILPESDQGDVDSSVKLFTRSDRVQSIEVGCAISETEPLVIEMLVDSDSPQVVLAAGLGPSIGNGVVDTNLEVHKLQGETWAPLAENDDWLDSDTASISEALALRGEGQRTFESAESALPLTLGSGRYRFSLLSKEGSGLGRLVISGQNWRD